MKIKFLYGGIGMKGKVIKMIALAAIMSMGTGKLVLASESFDQSINQGYKVQTEEERIEGEKKEKEADEYVKSKRMSKGTGGKKNNSVGTMTQENNYQLKWADNNWAWRLNNNVIWTVDKNYNVVANINHGKTTTPIHSVYANGIAHYVTIHGYDDVNKKYQVSDSVNNKSVPYKYSTNYKNMENSTKSRGIIW